MLIEVLVDYSKSAIGGASVGNDNLKVVMLLIEDRVERPDNLSPEGVIVCRQDDAHRCGGLLTAGNIILFFYELKVSCIGLAPLWLVLVIFLQKFIDVFAALLALEILSNYWLPFFPFDGAHSLVEVFVHLGVDLLEEQVFPCLLLGPLLSLNFL
jgi:hypothetical protein